MRQADNKYAKNIEQILSMSRSNEDILDMFLLHIDDVLAQHIENEDWRELIVDDIIFGIDKHLKVRGSCHKKPGKPQHFTDKEIVYLGRLIKSTSNNLGVTIRAACKNIARNWPSHIACPQEWQTSHTKEAKIAQIGEAFASWYSNNHKKYGYLFAK